MFWPRGNAVEAVIFLKSITKLKYTIDEKETGSLLEFAWMGHLLHRFRMAGIQMKLKKKTFTIVLDKEVPRGRAVPEMLNIQS